MSQLRPGAAKEKWFINCEQTTNIKKETERRLWEDCQYRVGGDKIIISNRLVRVDPIGKRIVRGGFEGEGKLGYVNIILKIDA